MIKKIFLYIVLFLVFSFNAVSAEWLVSVTWQESPGPNLDREDCIMGNEVKCSIMHGVAKICEFALDELTNQSIKIRSYNVQGAYTDFEGGFILEPPVSGSGLSIIIKWNP